MYPVKRNSHLAIASLVGGLLGWILLPLVGSIVAVVTGHMARKEIRLDPDLEGDGLAVIGLILGYSCLFVGLLSFLLILLFFGGFAFFAVMAN